MNERKFYIDWLRVFAMIGVFVYHCTRFFDPEDWHLKAPITQQSDVLPVVRQAFLWLWLLELFFFAAGYATFYSLKKRSAGQYVLDRVKRLLVPLYTVGLFLLLVPQAYFERFTHGLITGAFWKWLPGYFTGLPGEIFRPVNFANPILLVPFGFTGHFWFIIMLFLVSLAALAGILYLKSARGQRLTAVLARWSLKPGGILLFAIPLAVGRIALNWMPVTTDQTWGDFLWYLLFFVIGYMVASDERFTESMKKHGWLCLGLWLGLFIVVGTLFSIVLEINVDSWNGFSLPYLAWQITYALTSWSAVVFLLSLGAKYLNFTNRFLAYSSEAVLPFFLFHQTVILVIGWFVLPWQISGLAKFLIITLLSFPIILVLYELLVRHIPFMRFLFGMPPQKPSAAPQKMAAAAK